MCYLESFLRKLFLHSDNLIHTNQKIEIKILEINFMCNLKKIITLCIFSFCCTITISAQLQKRYWNLQTTLQPRRLPLPDDMSKITHIDLDGDGKPDVIKYSIMGGIPVMWVDDDHNMKWTDIEGDMINDCLFIDRNKDGKFSGPEDLSIKWADNNSDGKPDMEFIVENGKVDIRNTLDWNSNIMIIVDDDQEGVFKYIDWNLLKLRPWEHTGQCNFFTDYQGNVLFTKINASSFRISDLRYSWENPFIFWDFDKDGLSEMALRMLDIPYVRNQKPKCYMSDALKEIIYRPEYRTGKVNDSIFEKQPKEIDVVPSGQINYVALSYDLDNDNGQSNEFDFDMSLCFEGEGFNYTDQVNKFPKLRGLPAADTLLYDASWRKLTELIFPNRKTALDLTFNRGKWSNCYFVFDEDDDCYRWERVEFYEPKDHFKTGSQNGGLDNNPQADAVGDRAEFDTDFSGKGNFYIGSFDGKIHLFGAEWGAWRIDQTAFSFQGFGGLYDLWQPNRLQKMPMKFGTVKYMDTDNNGFIDQIQYDLDGDSVFEVSISFKELNINDKQQVINTSKMSYADFVKLYKYITERDWVRAQEAIGIATKNGVATDWYSFWKHPRTLNEKYDYAYWLNFYIYNDLRQLAMLKNDTLKVKLIDKAYYSGNWGLLK